MKKLNNYLEINKSPYNFINDNWHNLHNIFKILRNVTDYALEVGYHFNSQNIKIYI